MLGFPSSSAKRICFQCRRRGWKEPLEKEMATHSSLLAWRIPWTEEPGGLQSTGSKRVRHNLETKQQQQRFYARADILKLVTVIVIKYPPPKIWISPLIFRTRYLTVISKFKIQIIMELGSPG